MVVCVQTPQNVGTNRQVCDTLSDVREDYQTLRDSLGLSDDEIRDLGLWEPATGKPAELAEAYIRRSKKREDVASMRGQLRDVVKRAQEVGVQIRRVWFEQLSASKKSVTRREYADALEAIMDGKSKTFIVWKLDRFDRQGAGSVLSAVDRLEERRARLVTKVEHFDSSVKGTRTFIALYAERAREDAEDIAVRVVNGIQSHKVMGRKGPGVAPFGLTHDSETGKVFHHPTEYEAARKLADKLLERKTTLKTAHELNAEGYRTRTGKPWTFNGVSRLAQNPLFAGIVPRRERHADEYGNPLDRWSDFGDPVYNDDGTPLMCGQGVITPAEYFKIRALIRSRVAVATSKRGVRVGTYLLSASLRCGRCFGQMHGSDRKYHCYARHNSGIAICKGLSTLSNRADVAVSDRWLAYVSNLNPEDPQLVEIGRHWMAFADPESEAGIQHARESLASAQNRLEELSDRYWNPPVSGHRISTEEYDRQANRLTSTIAELSRALRELSVTVDVSALLEPQYLVEAWEGSDVETKRVLIKAVWPNGIVLLPPKARGDKSPIDGRLDFTGIPPKADSSGTAGPTAG